MFLKILLKKKQEVMMKLYELISFLESLAPLPYQESYDNSGLLVGEPDTVLSSALISLDCTEAVVDEAIAKGADVIISHHPIIFKGLKRFNNQSYVERVVAKAIKNDIALYAIHTNLDSVDVGVNAKICERLGIMDCSVLQPKRGLLKKLVTFCPVEYADRVRAALFNAGAGAIGNYSECSYNLEGFGTFKAGEGTDAFVGRVGELHKEAEVRIEVILPVNLERKVLSALFMAHPYEEIAYDIYSLDNVHSRVGLGMVGNLNEPMNEHSFMMLVKEELRTKVIRHTRLLGKPVQRIAVCGGSGSSLLKEAIRAGADVFITGDFKYHEFFDAEEKIILADVGHFESEQFTQDLLFENISKKFSNFALHLTSINTNPINYLI